MEQDLPEWLTADFLTECVRSKERFRECRVASFTAASAVPPGNNYGSYILRAKCTLQDADAREHTLSLILKCPLTSGTIKELFSEIYESEPAFYNELLPLGGQLLLNREFAAEHFRCRVAQVVVLEDLAERGYVMADKLQQLDLQHCLLYVAAAADFHAMSFAVHRQHPELVTRISKEKLFSNDMDPVAVTANKNMFRYCLTSFAHHAAQFLDSDRIPTLASKCSSVMWDLLVEAMSQNYTINTLNQGDPWLTNMMFKRDGAGNAHEIKLLDFQCLKFLSPVYDLLFFIWTSADNHVLREHQHTLYEAYLDRFNKALEEMKFEDRLTLKTVEEHAVLLSPVALWAVALGRPMILKPSFTDMDSMYARCKGEYSPDDNPYEELFTDSFCKNHLPLLVQCLDNSRVFEHIQTLLQKNHC